MIPGEPLVRWSWVADHLGEIARRMGEHVILTGLAVIVAFAISFGLVLLGMRVRWLAPAIGWGTGALYTVPSLALFALLVPITGLSVLTAEIGLVGYALNLLTRNIAEGLQAAPPAAREAALAMGYSPRQVVWQVEAPLALPTIIAGVRVATVSTIGLTTVTALVGQGGLGALILDGLQRFFSTPLIVGAALLVGLALVAELGLLLVERRVTPWSR
jgi:osmoprotectant transport system permease protein